MTLVNTINFEHGLVGSIYHDTDVEQPYEADDGVRIVVLHRRYIDPSRGACGTTPDELAGWERENEADWFIIPLFMYDHSGTMYRVGRTNPFSCPWDSGRVGIIALKRSEWGNGAESGDTLFVYAESIAYRYTSWANGECYGYILKDSSGSELLSCWGFIGMDAAEQELKAFAGRYAPAEENASS
jgi:hypothetical protein